MQWSAPPAEPPGPERAKGNDMDQTRIAPLARGALVLGLAVGLAACARVPGKQGFIIDPAVVQTVQPGVDNRASVERTMGRPSLTSQFSDDTWYYVSRNTKQYGFSDPTPTEQKVVVVTFDQAGNVASVNETGLELVRNISPDGDRTPTLGRNRSLLDEIFGNIGAVGAPGLGQGQNDPTRPQ